MYHPKTLLLLNILSPLASAIYNEPACRNQSPVSLPVQQLLATSNGTNLTKVNVRIVDEIARIFAQRDPIRKSYQILKEEGKFLINIFVKVLILI